ncbi:MAG: NDP-sugar synthase [Candidatus Firestonebacteria bacterium]
MKAVILVGGEGTRLRPLTLSVSKAVIPVVNQPLIFYILKWLSNYNLDEVILIACYLPQRLKKVLGSKMFGMKIKYIYEDKPLGTGGAIKRAEKFMDATTLVMNGDIITDLNISSMIKFHRRKKSNLTLALTPVENPSSYGVVETNKNNEVVRFLEKPSLDEISGKKANINAGVYLIEPCILKFMKKSKVYSIERDVFPKLLKNNFYGYIKKDIYWLDIGTPEKYKQINYDILNGRLKVNLALSGGTRSKNVKLGKNVKIFNPVNIGDGSILEEGVIVKKFSIIGKNCLIGKNSVLEGCILWNNVQVGEGCVLKDCIISDNSYIGDFSYLSGNLVMGPNSTITRYSKL